MKEISLTQQSVGSLSQKDASLDQLLALEESLSRQIGLLLNWIAHYDAVIKKSEHIHLSNAQKADEAARNETDFIKQKRDLLLSASATFDQLKAQLGSRICEKEEELALQNGTLLVKSVIPMLQSACLVLLERKGAYDLYAGSLLCDAEGLLSQLMSFTENQSDLKAEIAASFACEVKKVESEAEKELAAATGGANKTLFGTLTSENKHFFGESALLVAIPFLNVELTVFFVVLFSLNFSFFTHLLPLFL